MKPLHYTLAPSRRTEVHGVERTWTLCGLNLAFAADPLETDEPINCPRCSKKLAERTREEQQRSLPLNPLFSPAYIYGGSRE